MCRTRGSNALAIVARLNPIIRGWATYNRGMVSSKIFSSLDSYLWRLTYRWGAAVTRGNHKRRSWTSISAGSTSSETTAGCTAIPTTRRPERNHHPHGQIRLGSHRPPHHGRGPGISRRPRAR
ncbi:group II intron maturase-specific domain-containing protein [Mycobacterium sp. SM1]|uniref:group II intron maturase-specific domain-containing protein n=1 Tax=Mycobacterium sp. SM1 TaxID=2816243 RepID=UPI001F2074D8|nr:group II intron maturase-specific domain-containing protein [Mycobacterium sp. SM1]